MNDYFPILLIFGFVITFAIFIIILFSQKKPFTELENFEEKINDGEQMSALMDLVAQLRKENLELRRSLNKLYNEPEHEEIRVEVNDRY